MTDTVAQCYMDAEILAKFIYASNPRKPMGHERLQRRYTSILHQIKPEVMF
jgi:hypothetical protein